MLISQKELDSRIRGMSVLGVSETHKQYLIDSVNDEKNESFIRLIDELSSKTFWILYAAGPDEMRQRIEDHLAARKQVIDKHKECVNESRL